MADRIKFMAMTILDIPSPVGALRLHSDGDAITRLEWISRAKETQTKNRVLTRAAKELDEYFKRQRRRFTVPLAPQGTEFQQRVWSALLRIPHGETRSYGQLAELIGTGPRSLAGGCARNPIPILIPCHRVVGANGALGGYSGGKGIETKQQLLDLEAP